MIYRDYIILQRVLVVAQSLSISLIIIDEYVLPYRLYISAGKNFGGYKFRHYLNSKSKKHMVKLKIFGG